jgi:hypothetical protein
MSALQFYAMLYGQPRDAYPGTRPPAVADVRQPACLLHFRSIPFGVLATIDDAGTLRLLRLVTTGHPELDRLSDSDRATLQAAVMAKLSQRQELPYAA